ncbi:MAG: alpha/beta hydrolase [Ruminococcus sp.]|nr:alpha/beta hydrolase [Ruminococcus sp.]
MKKASKILVCIILVIVLLIALFVGVCFASRKLGQKKDRKLLTERGYCNLVDAGDIELNVPIFGFDDPDHTVVCMGGSGDSTFAPAMNNLASYVHGKIRYAVIERPGYGLSDVGKQDMTVEYVVECSRKALESAGIEAPYILLAHSLGGVYAEYWFNKYPDEVEGVLLLDTVFPGDKTKSVPADGSEKLLGAYETLGFRRMFDKDESMPMLAKMLPEAYQDTAKKLTYYDPLNRSLTSEAALIEQNLETVDSITQETDIPKVYLSTDALDINIYNAALQFDFDAMGTELTDEILEQRFEEYTSERDLDFFNARSLYLSKLGSVRESNLPSSHFIHLQYPDDVAIELEMLIEEIDGN